MMYKVGKYIIMWFYYFHGDIIFLTCFFLSKFCSALWVFFSWVVSIAEREWHTFVSHKFLNILGWYLKVSTARTTGSGWPETFICFSISHFLFKLLTILLKKELKVSVSSYCYNGFFLYAFSENSGFSVFQYFLSLFKIILSWLEK